jgi:hypothetical protein
MPSQLMRRSFALQERCQTWRELNAVFVENSCYTRLAVSRVMMNRISSMRNKKEGGSQAE